MQKIFVDLITRCISLGDVSWNVTFGDILPQAIFATPVHHYSDQLFIRLSLVR